MKITLPLVATLFVVLSIILSVAVAGVSSQASAVEPQTIIVISGQGGLLPEGVK